METDDFIPRRIRLDLMVDAEKAIYNAMVEVEKLPANVRLTSAVLKLQEAKNFVSDYVDEVNKNRDANANQ